MRFVVAMQGQAKDDRQVELVSRELWKRIWSQDKDITTPESLSEVGPISSDHLCLSTNQLLGGLKLFSLVYLFIDLWTVPFD